MAMRMEEAWRAAICGAAFGAALTFSGVYSPAMVIAQMRLQDFHMVQVFLAATGCSSIFIHLAERCGLSSSKPRQPSPLQHLGTYGGNVLGGLLIGFGMTLSGACPGTIFAQIGAGEVGSLRIFLGALIGGGVFNISSKYILPSQSAASENNPVESVALHAILNLPRPMCVIVYVTACGLVCNILSFFSLQRASTRLINPSIGGLAIGIVQVLSILLRDRTLGVSGFFAAAAEWCTAVRRLLDKASVFSCKRTISNIEIFATFMVAGSGIIKIAGFAASPLASSHPAIPAVHALLGGFFLGFGGLLAGGCTSGHGISGMAMLGVSSLVTVISMFLGGIGLAFALPVQAIV